VSWAKWWIKYSRTDHCIGYNLLESRKLRYTVEAGYFQHLFVVLFLAHEGVSTMSTPTPSTPICPRSILRYRPIDNVTTPKKSNTGETPEVQPWKRTASYPPRKTRQRTGTTTATAKPATGETGDAGVTTNAQAKRTRKLTRKIPLSTLRKTTQSVPVAKGPHWLLGGNHSSATLVTTLGIGMILTLTLITLGQMLFAWGGHVLDDVRYGNPRTYQTDAYVGHNETNQPSHFIALNNKGQVEVIEMPGNNASKARIFMGPKLTGADADQVPVTLRFVDTRHDHRPDMIVSFGTSSVVFTNANGTFRPAQPAELSEVTLVSPHFH
jgi:hypothetical protein